jgi:hypothetical protein
MLGQTDQAFREIDRAIEDRSRHVVFLAVDPRVDPLRADPRFAGAMDRIGLRAR